MHLNVYLYVCVWVPCLICFRIEVGTFRRIALDIIASTAVSSPLPPPEDQLLLSEQVNIIAKQLPRSSRNVLGFRDSRPPPHKSTMAMQIGDFHFALWVVPIVFATY